MPLCDWGAGEGLLLTLGAEQPAMQWSSHSWERSGLGRCQRRGAATLTVPGARLGCEGEDGPSPCPAPGPGGQQARPRALRAWQSWGPRQSRAAPAWARGYSARVWQRQLVRLTRLQWQSRAGRPQVAAGVHQVGTARAARCSASPRRCPGASPDPSLSLVWNVPSSAPGLWEQDPHPVHSGPYRVIRRQVPASSGTGSDTAPWGRPSSAGSQTRWGQSDICPEAQGPPTSLAQGALAMPASLPTLPG